MELIAYFCFTKENIIELFLSVDWQLSASNPDKLYTALINLPTVFTAWENNKLVGLARVLDDGILTAYIHYVLVNPKYQGKGIASNLVKMIKNKYKDYLYIELMPDEKKNVSFYQKLGFIFAESNPELELNGKVQAQWDYFETQQHKRRRAFIKEIK